MSARRPVLSEAEREVLKVLWLHGPATVREINAELTAQGRRWANTTVITLLTRLTGKGYAASDKSGFAHVFSASASKEDVVQERLADLADEFCDGAPAPLVLALVQGRKFSAAEVDRLRKLVDDLEPKPVRRGRP